MTLLFVALAFALAFWQRPGWATSDTKIDLHVDPSRFLHQVASVWTATTDLGEVHSAQYSGYLWPMGPFFAALHSIGLGAWVVQRLWLGLMLALSVWGILRLLDVLIGRPRGIAHVVAAAFYMINPYTTVFTARTTITLLGYAALPWLLLVTYHGVRATGLRDPSGGVAGIRGWVGRRSLPRWRPWWWAAAFALLLTSSGGGVNAAVVGWMLVGPLVLLIYEPAVGNARWRDAGGFLVRVGILSVLASLWWIVPLLVHVRYGIDFLQFTEQPATIWGTNNSTESLRLMGYWTSYLGVGFGVSRPYFSDGATMLFNPFVVGASLLLPALAVGGFVRARRLSYAPFLLMLVVVGALIMVAGFPDGTPLRGVMDWIYHHIFVLRFMRTTDKAAPLVACGFAGLLGLGAQGLLARLRRLRPVRKKQAAILGAGAALTALIVLAALPLVRGDAIDKQLSWKRIPAAWVDAGRGLDRQLPQNARAIVLPGQIFGYYTWGGTLDAILPRLTSRPVAVRYETPYSDLHAVDLLTTIDDLVQQGRLLPGELTPLLQLIGVRAVVTGSDDDISRSGAISPAAAAGVLAGQGLGAPSRSSVPCSTSPRPRAISDPESRCRRSAVTTSRPGGESCRLTRRDRRRLSTGRPRRWPTWRRLGRCHPAARSSTRATCRGVRWRSRAPRGPTSWLGTRIAGDCSASQSTQQNRGVTLGQADPIATGTAAINPFVPAGTDAQTVSVLQGARYLRSPTRSRATAVP